MKRILTLSFILCLGILFICKPGKATWEKTKRLTWNSGYSQVPTVAIDSNLTIHVVWFDNTSGNYEIYHKKSMDGGESWKTKRLTWNSGNSCWPVIAVDSCGFIHVVWFDNTPGNHEIYYMKSEDSGETWTRKRLTWTSGDSSWPVIAADSNNNLHVLWTDYTHGAPEIYYKKSTDGGETWGSSKRLTWNTGSSLNPSISIDSSNHLHVVWWDDTPGNREIYYKRSVDGGDTWTTKRLTVDSAESELPVIARDSNNYLHVVWSDRRDGNYELYYKKSKDGGVTWTKDKRLTWTSGSSLRHALAISPNNYLHLVWDDYSSLPPEIYYKKSTDGGETWTTKRLTWNSGDSMYPSLNVDSSNNVYVVWHDYTPGNAEIYYKKGN